MSGGIIAELTIAVISPTIKCVVRGDGAGVGVAGGDGFDGLAG